MNLIYSKTNFFLNVKKKISCFKQMIGLKYNLMVWQIMFIFFSFFILVWLTSKKYIDDKIKKNIYIKLKGKKHLTIYINN